MFLTQRNTLGPTQQNHMFGSAPAFAVSMDFNSREMLNEMFYHYLTTTLSSSSPSTSSTSTCTTTVSEILKQLYDTYCPAKVSSIPSIVTKYKDNETILFQKLWKKYQIPSAWLAYIPSSFSVENEINASEILSTETESVKIISHILSNIIDELINKTSETHHDDIAATTNLFSPSTVFGDTWSFCTSPEALEQEMQLVFRTKDMKPVKLQVSERLENPCADYADGNANEYGGSDADADGEEVEEVLQYIERDNCIWKVVRLNGRQWIELAVEMTDNVVESNRGFSFGGGGMFGGQPKPAMGGGMGGGGMGFGNTAAGGSMFGGTGGVINSGNKTLKSENGFGLGFGQRNMYDHDVESVVDTEANSRPAAGGFRFG